jgi:catechol 2,3-dioxygenase-like lactoylglutathione lyase family enzyme
MPDPARLAIHGAHHVGLTVPDMAQAVAFFVDVLGCELLFSEGPFDLDASRAASHRVPPGATLVNLTMLRCASGASLELFEYRCAGQRTTPVGNVDNGGHHVAFEVDDIVQSAARLAAAGVELCGAVNVSKAGPFAGLKWLYFVAPWGMQLELVEIPEGGIGYERDSGRRMYQPR